MKESKKNLTAYCLVLPSLTLFLLFFVIPIVILISNAFYHNIPGGGIIRTFTLENFLKFVSEPFYYFMLIKTFAISLIVVIISAIIGYPMAYFLARTKSRFKLLFMTVMLMPILVGGVIRAYGWQVILGNVGLINVTLMKLDLIDDPIKMMFTTGGVIIALTHVIVVFMILPIMSVIKKIDPALEEAAQDLGANRLKTFFRVTLPLSIPGIAAGSSLAFAVSVSAFVLPELVGGATVGMLGVEAAKQIINMLNWPFGAAISAILVFVSIVIMFVYERFLQKSSIIRGYF